MIPGANLEIAAGAAGLIHDTFHALHALTFNFYANRGIFIALRAVMCLCKALSGGPGVVIAIAGNNPFAVVSGDA
ncbi:MAG: hypothetical protein A2260_03340 [Candidatus Komeilibacteria bacterium RIFOXYA2_FULL_45_9]|nr:MAG: hypothetical protein A2260_03340 [Candidatus Komeilibacteria bacterium RIFOXYA2_FULL_45_9]